MRRWIAFSLVGVLGILIQLSTLAVLTDWLGLHYLLATGLAVEVALLHNFAWHESWTWADRSRGDKKGVWRRLVRFHFANGALSIAGNIILMRFFAGTLAVSLTVANALSITLCSILNFFASDQLVFQGTRGRRPDASGRPTNPCNFTAGWRRAQLCASACWISAAHAHPQTPFCARRPAIPHQQHLSPRQAS
jgi:dolichol-phosphate mannosyltransferase